MKKILLILISMMIATVSFAAQDDHTEHENEGVAHKLGQVSIDGRTYQVTVHGEIAPGTETAVGIEVDKAPAELRAWIGARNGRGSVKSLLRADSHGHFHGHLEVPAKLPHESAVWIDVVTDNGRQRGAVAIPESDHEHKDH